MKNIKKSYLEDKEVAVKNGHKIANELDDFLMWCTASNISIQGYMKELSPGKITLSMDSSHATIFFTIPADIIPSKEEYQINKQQAVIKIVDFVRAKGDSAVSYDFAGDGYVGSVYLGDLRQMNKDIEEFLDNKYKGE